MSAVKLELTDNSDVPNAASFCHLGEVRSRGVFVIEALLWATAGGFLLILAGYFVVLLNFSVSGAEHFRRILGGSVPATGPDWYALAVIGLGVLVPVCLLGGLFRWYKRIWKNRLELIWRRNDRLKHFSRIPGIADRDKRTEYLKCLLASDEWHPLRPSIKEDAGGKNISPEQYEDAATAIWTSIQTDIKDRALATGLIVGLSGNKWTDQITILIASLELQLHVLTRLGKKPNWGTWRTLLKRMLSSLFLNTYLTRQDAFHVQFLIKKTAMGLYVLSDLAGHSAEHLKDVDVDHLIDALDLDEAFEGHRHVAEQAAGTVNSVIRPVSKFIDALFATHGVPPAGSVVAETVVDLFKGGAKVGLAVTEFSLKTGATGLHLIGTFTDHYGKELTQGVAASVMLHSHGIEIAADCLALDSSHRAKMSRGYTTMLNETAKHAGGILFDQVKQLRGLFRQRRRLPVELVKTFIKGRPEKTETKGNLQAGSAPNKHS